MTTHKDFKHLVRARMAKTGESYTSARAKLIAKVAGRQVGRSAEQQTAGRQGGKAATQRSVSESAVLPPDRPAVLPSDRPAVAVLLPDRLADLAGMSDAKLKAATGCDWASWVKALDYAGADNWPHREIARYVSEKFKTPSWWTQTVAVGYERIKGLRVKGQDRKSVV